MASVDIRSKPDVYAVVMERLKAGTVRDCTFLKILERPSRWGNPPTFQVDCTEKMGRPEPVNDIPLDPFGITSPPQYAWPRCPRDCELYSRTSDFPRSLSGTEIPRAQPAPITLDLPTPEETLLVMISSTITGLEAERNAVDQVLRKIGLRRFRSEDHPSKAASSIEVCETQARECDLYIGILGANYGSPVPGRDISFVELEYRMAVSATRSKVLLFVRDNIQPDPRQRRFLDEVMHSKDGFFVARFNDADSLRPLVFKAIHSWLTDRIRTARAVGPPPPSLTDEERLGFTLLEYAGHIRLHTSLWQDYLRAGQMKEAAFKIFRFKNQLIQAQGEGAMGKLGFQEQARQVVRAMNDAENAIRRADLSTSLGSTFDESLARLSTLEQAIKSHVTGDAVGLPISESELQSGLRTLLNHLALFDDSEIGDRKDEIDKTIHGLDSAYAIAYRLRILSSHENPSYKTSCGIITDAYRITTIRMLVNGGASQRQWAEALAGIRTRLERLLNNWGPAPAQTAATTGQ